MPLLLKHSLSDINNYTTDTFMSGELQNTSSVSLQYVELFYLLENMSFCLGCVEACICVGLLE